MSQADPNGTALAVREAGPDVRKPTTQPGAWGLFVAVGSVLVFFAICLFAPDWGTAAAQSAEVASVLALICLGTGLVYLLLGARPGWLTWLVVGVLLAVLGFYELPTAVTPLRVLQANTDAAAGRYDAAYRELRLTGVGPCDPRAVKLLLRGARADERAGQYETAIHELREDLIEPCPSNPATAAARAEIGQAELAEGDALLQRHDYAGAVSAYRRVLDAYPHTELAEAARQRIASAEVAWADQLEREGHYSAALARYQEVLAEYPSTPDARAAYAGAARTLYDWGQSATRSGDYAQAERAYDQLLTDYPDTSQATQASRLLQAPQRVAGRLVHNDGASAAGVTVRLSSVWRISAGGYSTGGRQYTAVTDAAGHFVFDNVPPGSYLLDWRDASGVYTTFLDQEGQPLDVFSAPRLRGLTLANIDIDPSTQG